LKIQYIFEKEAKMGMEYFGDKLRALRTERKLTQVEMADRIGLVSAAISSYEKGKQYPSVDNLIKICESFNVSADYLLGFSDNTSFNVASLTDEQLQLILRLITEFEEFNSLKEKT
jgi:transcriptional regulator with XRE-family HTH domain